jgi:hypothetical protein
MFNPLSICITLYINNPLFNPLYITLLRYITLSICAQDAKAKGSHKSKKPPHRIDLKYITNQLDGTFRHFRANGE